MACRLARAAGTPDGARLAHLLRLAGLLAGPGSAAPAAPLAGPAAGRPVEGAPDGAERVGIWERRHGEPSFVRRMESYREWHYWASCGRIEPKGRKRRVVLVGESAARGYLYDPQFTPAMVLQAILERRLGGDGVEVVDLARTDLGVEVRELALEVPLLAPDAVVVFAGNNWRSSAPPPLQLAELRDLAGLLREQGLAALRRQAEEQVAASARRIVGEVSAAYAARGIPLLWMVPELNLGDWRDPHTNAPHLSGDANREWIEVRQAAEQALGAGERQRAAELARRLLDLDQGLAVAGFHILAACSLEVNDLEAARCHLEGARDAVIWDPSRIVSPRPYGAAQEAMRAEAARQGSLLVDLPRVFCEHLGGALPDRRLFLDYCHLTAAGIGVAMAAAASPLLRVLGGRCPARRCRRDGTRSRSAGPSPSSPARRRSRRRPTISSTATVRSCFPASARSTSCALRG